VTDNLNNFDDELDALVDAARQDEWNEIQEQMEEGTYEPTSLVPEGWHEVSSSYEPCKIRISRESYDAIMFNEEPCPACHGTGRIQITEQWEETDRYHVINKSCPVDFRMKSKLGIIKKLLPSRYYRSNIGTLKPSPNSKMDMQRQATVIQHLWNNSTRSFLFYGDPGTGKTTFATALVRHALERDWEGHIHTGCGNFNTVSWIQYLNWDTYIQSLLDWQNHPDTAEEPSVTPTLIHNNAAKGRTTCLVIEEIDKSRLTEFKANKLFELVCAMDATESQLIITTNYATKEEFQSWLCQGDTRIVGEAIWRRLSDNCKFVSCPKAK
jgi:DNA replication protein DnaC